METMDDPFIPQRGRRTLKMIQNKRQVATPHKSDNSEFVSSTNGMDNGIKTLRTMDNNGYFLPLRHPLDSHKALVYGTNEWKRTLY